MPRLKAVMGFTSIQFPHTTDVIGSGISCSQGRFAPLPSRWLECAYVVRKNGNPFSSPSNLEDIFEMCASMRFGDTATVFTFDFSSGHHPPLVSSRFQNSSKVRALASISLSLL